MSPLGDVLREFTKLGFVAFGGPPAHVALMLKRFTDTEGKQGQLAWISEESFVSLFALTQCLPGPSSTQLATALGALHAGFAGGIAAFVCFDLPGFVVMATTGIAFHTFRDATVPEALAPYLERAQIGLAAATVALLANAALALTSKCAPDKLTRMLATGSAAAATLVSSVWLFPIVLAIGGVATSVEARNKPIEPVAAAGRSPADSEKGGDKASLLAAPAEKAKAGRPLGYALFALWAALMVGECAFGGEGGPWWVQLSSAFYRTGSLVWGGGQVVLPMLLRELCPKWMVEAAFVRGFALVQALPGPVFNFSAYLGGVAAGPVGALLAWASLFLPGLLLILAALPFWLELQQSAKMKAALRGCNAAASGLVVAATLILAQACAATLPTQVITLVCFAGIAFFGVHQAAAILLGAALAVPLCAATECGEA